ncbi:AbrB family transcriptional regulator [Gordonia sp. (in: high G+C Gram-positive bacteria)]|uniref:AbrB family transcriptional regulator n=1 Tax=Gordonia sp. (in: high G+C Gram-positive bacteria) TaxID=84139 RepID=UPI003F9721DA
MAFADHRREIDCAAVVRWLVCVTGTAIIGEVLSAVHCPAAWLIAGLVVSAATALASGHELTPHRHLLRPAQGTIGVVAAAPLAMISGGELIGNLGVSLGTAFATLVLCLFSAFILYRMAREMDPPTAVLSTLAGGASGISTMAPELGVDHRYVSMSQYFRLVIVTLTLPALLVVAGGHEGTSHADDASLTPFTALLLVVLIVGVGHVGKWLHLPSPFLLAPLIVTLVLGVFSDVTPVPTGAVTALAYVVIGWQAGGSLSRASVRAFGRLLPVTLSIIALTILGCLAMAWAMSATMSLSFSDAYLATTPGGIYAALAVAQSAGAGPIVTTAQVVRLIVMLITAIAVARYFARKHAKDVDSVASAAVSERLVR